MQNNRQKLISRAATAGGAFVLAASFAAVTSGQDASSGHSMHHGHQQMGSDEAAKTDTTGGGCHEMMEAHQHMMSGLDAMNATLDGLIAEMDASAGETRLDAMTKVIHELVAQRQQMAGMMASSQPKMMAHMMSHMGGDGAGMKTAMAECPAMKGMMDASGGSETGAHESHDH